MRKVGGPATQLDGRSNAEIHADRYYTGSSARRIIAVGDLPTSFGAPQLILQDKRVLPERPPYYVVCDFELTFYRTLP